MYEASSKTTYTIALAGNPNVGKSTVFNALTGMKQHTGNWSGKTVDLAYGTCGINGFPCTFVDLPGCYSLHSCSKEEEITRDFLLKTPPDVLLLICDAVSLERNFNLVLQALSVSQKAVLCINFMDQAEKRGLQVSCSALEKELKIPVLGITARKKADIQRLKQCLGTLLAQEPVLHACGHPSGRFCHALQKPDFCCAYASQLYQQAIKCTQNPRSWDAYLDRLFTGKYSGVLFMVLFLFLIFWLTLTGANSISDALQRFLFGLEPRLLQALSLFLPKSVCDLLIYGIYRVTAWVVSVMLPPMALFFPLFTLLEDFGYLPRVAFNMDCCFSKCRACGKQALTMMMGFGCNAAGVTGCRIIDSPRERLIAILTNSFVPCNGRFPTILMLLTLFFTPAFSSLPDGLRSLCLAGILTLVILFGVLMTFAVSWFLSRTFLKGVPSSFTLELPPYRKPQILSVLLHSVTNRTLQVLGRALLAAAPAGLLLWTMAHIQCSGASLLALTSQALDPFGRLLGLDGTILLAFILGIPANEIVIPIMIMAYTSSAVLTVPKNLSSLYLLLEEHGWTFSTAVSMLLLCVMHWPCMTTLLTIKKETRSLKWTAFSFWLPTGMGFLCCFLSSCLFHFFGL